MFYEYVHMMLIIEILIIDEKFTEYKNKQTFQETLEGTINIISSTIIHSNSCMIS